jgi:hypothetical protein
MDDEDLKFFLVDSRVSGKHAIDARFDLYIRDGVCLYSFWLFQSWKYSFRHSFHIKGIECCKPRVYFGSRVQDDLNAFEHVIQEVVC